MDGPIGAGAAGHRLESLSGDVEVSRAHWGLGLIVRDLAPAARPERCARPSAPARAGSGT